MHVTVSVQPVKMAAPLSLTTKQLEAIKRALPDDANPHRLTLLPDILTEWAQHDLQEYASSRETRESIRQTSKRYQDLITAATKLSSAMDVAIESSEHILIALKLGEFDGTVPTRDCQAHYTDKILAHREFLRGLIAASSSISKRSQSGPGRPPNNIAYVALLDISAIFEWITLRKATRRVDPIRGVETGPFYLFASTIWPIIFSNTKEGLPAAMKNWASAKLKYRESSAIIANMNLRHPLWRVFDR
jgi:hypothetical protein